MGQHRTNTTWNSQMTTNRGTQNIFYLWRLRNHLNLDSNQRNQSCRTLIIADHLDSTVARSRSFSTSSASRW